MVTRKPRSGARSRSGLSWRGQCRYGPTGERGWACWAIWRQRALPRVHPAIHHDHHAYDGGDRDDDGDDGGGCGGGCGGGGGVARQGALERKSTQR